MRLFMITERPGGVSPNEPSKSAQDAKAQREHAQKVERVREIDADEEAQKRRRRFQMMMGDEDQLADVNKAPRAPSPFEVEFHKAAATDQSSAAANVASPYAGGSLFGEGPDMDNEAIVPSPSYSPPPNVSTSPETNNGEEEENLPSSQTFWRDSDFSSSEPPTTPKNFQETDRSTARNAGQPGKPKAPSKEKSSLPGKPLKPELAAGKEMKKEKAKDEQAQLPFPGKMEGATPTDVKQTKEKKPEKLSQGPYYREEETPASGVKVDEEHPFDEVWGAIAKPKKESARQTAEGKKETEKERAERSMAPVEREKDREGKGGGKERGPTLEIAPPVLPALPANVQPIAYAAVAQATSYLSPETIPLFFQMVGTLYVMTTPPGISRTEIVLNNPAYSNSRFFGARITIEKYATAPDSFNIRLSGTNTAVVAFQQNIPSLMTAFQNGNFSFRVNRLEAEFSIERPVFRRKERGGGGSEAGGDLGERRKK